MRAIILSAAMFVGMTAAAHAAVFGSAPAYGGGSQSVAVCYVSNIGNIGVRVTSARIFKEAGVSIPLSANNCSYLYVWASCRIVANIQAGLAHWCHFDVDNKANLRGRMEVRSSSAVLTSEEMK
jgi:hypothetical protein